MLAYLFWHRPYPTVDARAYEEALVRFQQRLMEQPPPGLQAAGSYRISPVPWLDGPGYEDWCYLDGSWALDPLNAFAIAGAVKGPHDHLAAQAETGYGGLWRLMWGTPDLPKRQTVTWMTRPRGIDYRAVLEPLLHKAPNVTCWRRQMVLGPAPEFAVIDPSGEPFAAPDGWTALHVRAERLEASGKA